MSDGIEPLLRRWGVVPEGPAVRTATSHLVFGRQGGRPVVLKVAPDDEERRGARLLAWWAGRGAVRVLALRGDAVLLERAAGARDLAAWSRAGRDDEATELLVRAAQRLHASGVPPAAVGLLPLPLWFRDLTGREHADPLLTRCSRIARALLDGTRPGDVVALHGDLHHGNVLDTGDGWAAIDPKGLLGHRAFDVANLFCNPDERTAVAQLDRRLPRVAGLLGVETAVLRDWVTAWCGLSLVWSGDGSTWHAGAARAVAERLAGAEPPVSAR